MEWNPDYSSSVPNEHEGDSQNLNKSFIHGIEIYEDTEDKLKISHSGKIYRYKIWHFMPLIGPLMSYIYLNHTYGKTRCLNFEDRALFRKSKILANLWALLFWPLIMTGLILLVTFLIVDIGSTGTSGNFLAWWKDWAKGWDHLGSQSGWSNKAAYGMNMLFNPTNVTVVMNAPATAGTTATGGLFGLFLTPLTTTIADPTVGLPIDLWFIIAYVVWTMLDVHTFIYGSLMNKRKQQFFTVYENLDLYKNR